MKDYVSLGLETGSTMDIALEKIIVIETNEHFGVGSRFCSYLHNDGTSKSEVDFSISLSDDKREELYLDGKHIPKNEFSDYRFRFTNNDY